ncbi:MAG: poly-gamma-glutamate hydrolase family protein, partial [Gammaproteobacteria bacterium]|nr:poly-gamma-glutamate hydrolase family protein [Gammaproteobacteria bacterium]
HGYYSFQGLKDGAHHLHITSDNFDEPRALSLVAGVETVISIHGARGQKNVVYFGGLDRDLGAGLMAELNATGFLAQPDPSPTRQGRGKSNICNRGRTGRGVQLELPQGFRKLLFDKPDYRNCRWTPNRRFHEFVRVIRNVLAHHSR